MTSRCMAIGDVRCNLVAPLSVPANRPLCPIRSNPVADHRLQVHIIFAFILAYGVDVGLALDCDRDTAYLSCNRRR